MAEGVRTSAKVGCVAVHKLCGGKDAGLRGWIGGFVSCWVQNGSWVAKA